MWPAHGKKPPLCGTFELASAVDRTDEPASQHHVPEEKARILARYRTGTAAKGGTANPQQQQHPRRSPPPRRTSGLLVYAPDGRMWTQCHLQDSCGNDASVSYTGKWWYTEGSGYGNPPHGGQNLVEHYVKESSEPSLVGKSLIQQYDLSDDGKRLTTTDVQILLGRACVTERLEWRRLDA